MLFDIIPCLLRLFVLCLFCPWMCCLFEETGFLTRGFAPLELLMRGLLILARGPLLLLVLLLWPTATLNLLSSILLLSPDLKGDKRATLIIISIIFKGFFIITVYCTTT